MSQTLKRANEYFGVTESDYKKTGAFNPVIGVDSLFFVDPLLLSKTRIPEFKDAQKEVRDYFASVITLIRSGNQKAKALAHKKLILREVRGIGIGYGSTSDDGSAIGPKLAKRLLNTAEELIQMGITDPAIFEVMGLFEEDFGPDRLSDGLTRILLKRVCQYSERITKELKIIDTYTLTTYERKYTLTKHPLKDGPLLFVPQGILRDLPIANSFEEISVVAIFNEDLRKKFNSILASCFAGDKNKKPKKSEIKKYLLETKDGIKTVVAAYQSCSPESYNFDTDPSGLYLWLEKAKQLARENPISLPSKPKQGDIDDVVQKVIQAFKRGIESKGWWKSLYNESKESLNESHARHFFYATALLYCEACDIDISPESNAGQGPVDFKLSRGHKKIVVEIKLTSGHVRQGYEKQTRIYEESEDAEASYFLVVQVTEKSKVLQKVLKMEEVEEKEGKKHPTIVVVDGREKPSASHA